MSMVTAKTFEAVFSDIDESNLMERSCLFFYIIFTGWLAESI